MIATRRNITDRIKELASDNTFRPDAGQVSQHMCSDVKYTRAYPCAIFEIQNQKLSAAVDYFEVQPKDNYVVMLISR